MPEEAGFTARADERPREARSKDPGRIFGAHAANLRVRLLCCSLTHRRMRSLRCSSTHAHLGHLDRRISRPGLSTAPLVENAQREVERDPPVRLVDDLADPEVAGQAA